MWKQKEKIQPCTPEQVKPNAIRRALGIFKPSYANITPSSSASPSIEELRKHQLRIEQRRSIAIEYARRNTLR
jgi:hypothetical protein